MRAACLAAFQPEITARTADAFYVRIAKELTVNQKRAELAASRARFEAAKQAHPGLSDSELQLVLIKAAIAQMATLGKWQDRWLTHPLPDMSEPQKAVCYLTDCGDYDADHLAWLYRKASLHGIDRFFMQVRRRLSLLERPIASASKGQPKVVRLQRLQSGDRRETAGHLPRLLQLLRGGQGREDAGDAAGAGQGRGRSRRHHLFILVAAMTTHTTEQLDDGWLTYQHASDESGLPRELALAESEVMT